MKTKEEQEARKDRKCRHFRSIMEGKTCHAGVIYKSLGNGYQWPCHGDVGEDISVCEKHEPYTAAEIETEQSQLKESLRLLREAFKVINTIWGSGGVIECPKCGGSLQWSRAAYNGHVHGQCLTTAGCMSWMQ